MQKDFDDWNVKKQKIDSKVIEEDSFFHERDIVWTNCGLNIGIESNGKDKEYARPALILKKLNKDHYIVLFCTTTQKENKFYFKINSESKELKNTKVILTQVKAIDRKRIIKKLVTITDKDFVEINRLFLDVFKNNLSPIKGDGGLTPISN